jgi:hypothetical protein
MLVVAMLSFCFHRYHDSKKRTFSSTECFFWTVGILLLAGCNGDPDRQRIVGDWEIAVADKLLDQVNTLPENSDKRTPETSAGRPPKMLIRFYNSGYLLTQTNMGPVKSEKKGSWKFLSYDAQTNSAQIECFLLDETTKFDVQIEDKNTIRLVPPNMAGLTKKIKFVRQ